MTTIRWEIPPSTLSWLGKVPTDRPVAMLIRHSVRDFLPPGDAGYTLPITDTGRVLAVQLGEHLRGRLRFVHASPLLRTMQTATCLAEGAGIEPTPRPDRLLGDPGVFVVDDRAGETWAQHGHEEVMRRLVEEPMPPFGCADAEPAARFLVHHMLATAGEVPGIHAFATHDSLVTATVARLVGERLTANDWPWYLEAAFFWRDEQGVHAAYRTWHATRPDPVVSLTEADVVGFARREVAATVGLDCPARFFLAGGAFKTLLTGRAPRDLDLWAPSREDRAALVDTLRRKGAVPLPEVPYTEGFRLGDRTIEVPLNTAPGELEARLLRFDLALAAVGAEFLPGDEWRAVVHPRAVESMASRQVLLLDELLNWRHSLSSLVRMRRYANELGYAVPESEVARVWSIFESQPPDVQAEMVQRFRAVPRGDAEIEADVERRFGRRGEGVTQARTYA